MPKLLIFFFALAILSVTTFVWASESDEIREKAKAMQREAAELAEKGHKEEAATGQGTGQDAPRAGRWSRGLSSPGPDDSDRYGLAAATVAVGRPPGPPALWGCVSSRTASRRFE